MLLAGAWYTILVTCLNVIAQGGGSNLFLPEEYASFDEEEIRERIKGSKIVVVSEQAMLNVIYTIKTCMLLMYMRLTTILKQQRLVKAIAVYVGIGFVATEITFFTACRPFHGYWAVPPPNPQCTTLQYYAIVQAVFNISSDFLMLGVMLPLLKRVNIQLKQKAALLVVFGMGFFVIVAAILTKVFNLSNVWSPTYMLWYTREASTATYVSNLPVIWPMLREWFPYLRKLTPGYQPPSGRHYGAGSSSLPLSTRKKITSKSPFQSRAEAETHRDGSKEHIVVETTYDIEESSRSFDGEEEKKREWQDREPGAADELGLNTYSTTITGGSGNNHGGRRDAR